MMPTARAAAVVLSALGVPASTVAVANVLPYS